MKTKNSKTKNALIISYICFSILIFAVVLIIPSTRDVFSRLSKESPYLMGFIKFALLATAGELLAPIVATGKPNVPVKIVWRFIIWGFIGMWITLMMTVYKTAVANMDIIGSDIKFLSALYTSILMNTTFGPTFMAVHKCTDKMLELCASKEKICVKSVMTGIDWSTFASFTIGKTVPFFWIPAHTVTFLLPAEFQVMMAAALSVALGVFLSIAGRSKNKSSLKKEKTDVVEAE